MHMIQMTIASSLFLFLLIAKIKSPSLLFQFGWICFGGYYFFTQVPELNEITYKMLSWLYLQCVDLF